MKILLVNRHDLLTSFGGDSVKTLKTKEYLEKGGVQVELALGKPTVDLKKYDLIHIFNLQHIRLTPRIIKMAKKAKRPVVLSTIFWHSPNTTRFIYNIYKKYHPRYSWPIDFTEKVVGKKLSLNVFDFFHKLRFFYREKYALSNTDWIIVESPSELENLTAHFELPDLKERTSVVANGVSEELLSQNPVEKFHLTRNLPDDFVLCVGRIHPVKNQINLVKALFDESKIPLVFIGAKAEPHGYVYKYEREFKELVAKRTNTFWFDNLKEPQLAEFYTKAKAFVQPSFWETLGIALFEAGAFGCSLVTTIEGGAKDYLNENAFYCKPDNPASIRKAVISAWQKPKTDKLKDYFCQNFTWPKIAKETIKAYEMVMKRKEY